MSSTTFHFRLPSKLKKDAQTIIEKNGIDMPSAMRLFLHHVVAKGTIPLQWITVNGFTDEAEKKILEQIEKKDTLKVLKSTKDIDAFVDGI